MSVPVTKIYQISISEVIIVKTPFLKIYSKVLSYISLGFSFDQWDSIDFTNVITVSMTI